MEAGAIFQVHPGSVSLVWPGWRWVNVLVADAEEVKKQLVQCFTGEIHHLGLPFPSRLPLRLRRVYYWCITSVTGITGAISI